MREFGSENILFFPVSILCNFGVQEAIENFGENLEKKVLDFLEPVSSFSRTNNRDLSMLSSMAVNDVPYDFKL